MTLRWRYKILGQWVSIKVFVRRQDGTMGGCGMLTCTLDEWHTITSAIYESTIEIIEDTGAAMSYATEFDTGFLQGVHDVRTLSADALTTTIQQHTASHAGAAWLKGYGAGIKHAQAKRITPPSPPVPPLQA